MVSPVTLLHNGLLDALLTEELGDPKKTSKFLTQW